MSCEINYGYFKKIICWWIFRRVYNILFVFLWLFYENEFFFSQRKIQNFLEFFFCFLIDLCCAARLPKELQAELCVIKIICVIHYFTDFFISIFFLLRRWFDYVFLWWKFKLDLTHLSTFVKVYQMSVKSLRHV